jgi:hypothetical protein
MAKLVTIQKIEKDLLSTLGDNWYYSGDPPQLTSKNPDQVRSDLDPRSLQEVSRVAQEIFKRVNAGEDYAIVLDDLGGEGLINFVTNQYRRGLTTDSNGSRKFKIGDDVVVAKGPYRSGAVGKVTTVSADGKTVRVKFGASPESESFPVSQVRLAGQ